MIGVDARKAFDSIDHNYMQGVLEAYGFGPKCLDNNSFTHMVYLNYFVLS